MATATRWYTDIAGMKPMLIMGGDYDSPLRAQTIVAILG